MGFPASTSKLFRTFDIHDAQKQIKEEAKIKGNMELEMNSNNK